MPDNAPSPHEDPAGAPPTSSEEWHALHLWQIQPVRDVLLGLAIFGLLYLGYLVSIVTVPLLLAVLFAYLLEPAVQKLSSTRRLNRRGAAVVMIVASVLIVVVPVVFGVGFAVIQGVGVAGQVAQKTTTLVASIEAPEDENLYEALPAGGWRSLRDYIVNEQQRLREAPALACPWPWPAPRSRTPIGAAPPRTGVPRLLSVRPGWAL